MKDSQEDFFDRKEILSTGDLDVNSPTKKTGQDFPPGLDGLDTLQGSPTNLAHRDLIRKTAEKGSLKKYEWFCPDYDSDEEVQEMKTLENPEEVK